ncbi:MAG: hypothetical protein DMF69_05210 [Acidobacteria bacterium]|nr:MAG: hypothetical protein DMF69_05210 [Acidobacteriota bacterium]
MRQSAKQLKPARLNQTANRSSVAYDKLPGARECRRKFLRFFPEGFNDETYIAWEREYKWLAHEQWNELLSEHAHRRMLRAKEFREIANIAIRIESRTNLLFSFEKMALRDAVKTPEGARLFSTELYDFLYGSEKPSNRFERWCDAVGRLPRKQTRVLTWPIVTVFGFIALPEKHIYLKPTVTRTAAKEYGFEFQYQSRPSWATYKSLLDFGMVCRRDLRDLQPRDQIDIQSFIWVLGSDEYEE